MNNKKGFFISLIIFLGLLILLSVLGGYYKTMAKPIEEEKEEEPTFTKKLTFYSESNELLGEYLCQNTYCDFASTVIDDSNYSLDYYQYGIKDIKTNVINEHYAFVYDTNEENDFEIILYDFINNEEIGIYKALKNYQMDIEDNIYFVKDENNKWGILSFTASDAEILMPCEYDFIGLDNTYDSDSNKLIADHFAVLKKGKWAIVDRNNIVLSAYIDEPIISYTGLYIKTKVNNYYKIYDYNGEEIKAENDYIHIAITGKYIEFVTSKNKLFVYNPEIEETISKIFTLRKTDFSSDVLYPPYSTELLDNTIKLKIYTSQEYGTFIASTISLN